MLKKQVDFDCPERTVEVLQETIRAVVNDAFTRRNNVVALLKHNIETVVFGALEEKLAEIDKKLVDLQVKKITVSGDEVVVNDLGDPSCRKPTYLLRGRRTQCPAESNE